MTDDDSTEWEIGTESRGYRDMLDDALTSTTFKSLYAVLLFLYGLGGLVTNVLVLIHRHAYAMDAIGQAVRESGKATVPTWSITLHALMYGLFCVAGLLFYVALHMPESTDEESP